MRRDGGYLIIDHRNSPGLPEEVALAMGLDPKLVGAGKILEASTVTCAHCKGTVMKNPLRTRERTYCPKCRDTSDNARYVCDGCALEMRMPDYTHTPFEKKREDHVTLEAKRHLIVEPGPDRTPQVGVPLII